MLDVHRVVQERDHWSQISSMIVETERKALNCRLIKVDATQANISKIFRSKYAFFWLA